MSLQIFNERQKAAIQSINRILTELPPPDVQAAVAGMVVLGLDVLAGGISPVRAEFRERRDRWFGVIAAAARARREALT